MPEFPDDNSEPRRSADDAPTAKENVGIEQSDDGDVQENGEILASENVTSELAPTTIAPSRQENLSTTAGDIRATSIEIQSQISVLRRRTALRTAIYFLYDSVAGEKKEPYRVMKTVLETILDECMPPPHRADMSLWRKFSEYLAPCALSSLIWFSIEQIRLLHKRALIGKKDVSNRSFILRAAWATVHRTARQAVINRLFFRMGSVEYSLASLLGIICCFFREDIFFEIYRLKRWPKYFSLPQGMGALLKSLVYAAAFSIPLQKLSSTFEHSRRRRGNVKKFIFSIVLLQIKQLSTLSKHLAAMYPR